MGGATNNDNLSITLIMTCLMICQISGADKNTPPTISLSMPYSGRQGVQVLSEETPLNSYLGIMEAKDGDTGPAGEVNCRTDNPYINTPLVYPKTYKIELAQELDRETVTVVEVSILCSDNGTPPMTTTAAFTIEVTDVNDNPPIFAEASYSANVTEGADIGTHVITLTAIDPDSEQFGIVHYSLLESDAGNSSNFTVNEKTGEILTNIELDREVLDLYTLTIVARDSGVPSLSSTVEVTIHVQDINDNVPVILTTAIRVKENQKPMESVGKIAATDSDIGKNAELVFTKLENSKSMSNTPFLVHPSGEILSAVTLDREQRPHYAMEVAVRDKGQPRHSSTATINIIVEDVNDNYPVIVSPCLDEDNDFDLESWADLSNETESGFVVIDWYSPEGGSVVYQVEAEDNDLTENGQLVFSIEPITNPILLNATTTSTTDPLFKINEVTGEVLLNRRVQHYDYLTHVLNISATDKGTPSLSAFCAVHITLNIDPAHLTPPTPTSKPKPPKSKPKPTKKSRRYRNSAKTLDPFKTHFLERYLSLILCSFFTYIFVKT